MPRKSPRPPLPMGHDEEMVLSMPVPVGTPHRDHEHRVDPYRTLPGAVPKDDAKPKTKAQKKEAAEAELRAAGRLRLSRYDRFLDNLAEFNGDEVLALAAVYQLEPAEVKARHEELIIDVQAGVPTSSINEDLKRRHLGQAAITRLLAKWAYSANPAASLKAIDKITEMNEQGPDMGSFEMYARVATQKE
jgi:hypothetical protein